MSLFQALLLAVLFKMSGKEVGYQFSRIVRVSGEDATPVRDDEYKKTNFVVDFGYNLQQVKRVSVMNVAFMNNAFNFIETPEELSNINFTIELENGTLESTTYTINPGFYNITQILTDLNDAAAEFKVAHPLSPTVTFEAPTTSGFIRANIGVTTAGYTWRIFDSNSDGGANSLGPIRQIGFSSGLITTSGAANVQSANVLPSLQGLTDVSVVSSALAPGNCYDEKNLTSSVLVVIPVTAPFGTLNVFECKQDVLCEVSYPVSRNIQQADFSLRDRFGNLVNLNGANLKITLRVWYNSY